MLYAGYCFLLPGVPPKKDNVEKIAFARAFALMKRPSVFLLVIASIAISMIHQIYFIQTGEFFKFRGLEERYIGPAMTIGQFAEIAVMAVLGLMLTKLRIRWVITIGALAYFARYGIWAIEATPLWLVVASQVLHGFCYACFFAGTYIYIDRVAPVDVRHSAQTVIGIMILGVGPALSAFVFPLILDLTGSSPDSTPPLINYSGLWGTLSAIGLAVALLVALGFKEEREPEPDPALVPEPEIP
jgi:MFS family permease